MSDKWLFFLSFIRHFTEQIKKDPINDWAATLAFYFMLSIFPLLIFILALIPYLPINTAYLHTFISDFAPAAIGELFTTTILEVIEEPKGGLLSFGILASIWSASNGINAFTRALNRAYAIEETRSFFYVRFMSIVMTLGMVLVIVITLLLPVFGNIILETLTSIFGLSTATVMLFNKLRWIVGIAIMTTVLLFIYYLAPNKRLPIPHVTIGAVTATISWQLISLGFSAYISNFSNYSTTYGSLGGIIILMLWFFLSGVILVLGGEVIASIDHVHQKRLRSKWWQSKK
ncbi:MAG TPA: YihY/virulence factor BrkB family protein [Bacilli bacterium]|nr:YihY/virulence factor BrkB family protein [Bacilli bacterium]